MLFVLTIFTLQLFNNVQAWSSPIFAKNWLQAFDNALLKAHRFSPEYFEETQQDILGVQPYIVCAGMDQNSVSSAQLSKVLRSPLIYRIYHKKSSQLSCYLAEGTGSSIASLQSYDISYVPLPSLLKVHHSVYDFANDFFGNEPVKSHQNWNDLETNPIHSHVPTNKAAFMLTIEFSPFVLTRQPLKFIAKRFLAELLFSTELNMNWNQVNGNNNWEHLLYQTFVKTESLFSNLFNHSTHNEIPIQHPACIIKESTISYNRRSFDIVDLSEISQECIVSIMHRASVNKDVISVSINSRPQLLNFEARGLVQSGRMAVEPYTEAGLTGMGQICAVADSGLNDISCFFIDDSNMYPTRTTNRSGILEPNRRKVIQYYAYADGIDDEGGHGTHVCGSIAGSSKSSYSKMNGMAPDAKIAFFDVGMTDRSFLKIPALFDILNRGYEAGARVHTNSWGNLGGLYGQMSFDLDDFVYENPDMLVLFAGGNSGQDGSKTIISPGNAKNALTVGAHQVRSILDDEPLSADNIALATFSSIGPTYDGRIKPDICAPGDFVESAFSGPTNDQRDAVKNPFKSPKSMCGVIQMSGTSMATPVTAGTALLVRQYFTDSGYWDVLCNKRYSLCQTGSFIPTGYLLKALFIHSGQRIRRYADPLQNSELYAFESFELYSPPDYFQGYGKVLLQNILPLSNNKGLDSSLDLIIWDKLRIPEFSTFTFEIDITPRSKDYATLHDDSVQDDDQIHSLQNSPPIKITICWYDPPATLSSSSNLLVNDLDLVVESPEGDYFLGNHGRDPIRSVNVPEIGKTIHTDDSNPNEQVFIIKPKCAVWEDENNMKNLNCVYKVRIQSGSLVNKFQTFAVVVTTNGTATEPVLTKSDNSVDRKHRGTAAPSPTMIDEVFHTVANLRGGEFVSNSFQVDTCLQLVEGHFTLEFQSSGRLGTWPSNIELTVIDVNHRAFAIGGADMSVKKSKIVTEWPDEWISERNGVYKATIQLSYVNMHGIGPWQIYVMNSWSRSEQVRYNLTAQFMFDSGPNGMSTCSPTLSPTSNYHTRYPSISFKPSSAPVPIVDRTKSIDVKHVLLGVHTSNKPVPTNYPTEISNQEEEPEADKPVAHFEPDRILIQKFNETGTLKSVHVVLNEELMRGLGTPSRGSTAWLFSVIVTNPEGLSVQIGGYEWFAKDNKIYQRRWPDVWVAAYGSTLTQFKAVRDVSSAELRGYYWKGIKPTKSHPYSDGSYGDGLNELESSSWVEKDGRQNYEMKPFKNQWKVEVAYGYGMEARDASEFNGNILLYFEPTRFPSINEVTPSPTVNGSSEGPGTIKKKSLFELYFQVLSDTIRNNFVFCVVIALLLCIYGIYECCKKPRVSEQNVDELENLLNVESRSHQDGVPTTYGTLSTSA